MDSKVNKEIKNLNPWYINDQNEWACKPYVINIYNGRFKFISDAIIKYCEAKDDSVHLADFGCGDGVWLKRISELKIKNLVLTGIDYNELRIKRARAILNDDINLINEDIEEIESKKYNIVLLNHVIEHVKEDELLLKRISTILSDDGILILGTPNEGNYLMQRRNRKRGYFATTDHVHFYTERNILLKIKNTGYVVENFYRDPFYIGNDKIFYKFLSYPIGFKIFLALGYLIPYFCSGFLFILKLKDE